MVPFAFAIGKTAILSMWPMENLSFRGKPHLRCQTIHKCNVERQKYLHVRTFLEANIQYNFVRSGHSLYTAQQLLSRAVPDLLLLTETQIRQKTVDLSIAFRPYVHLKAPLEMSFATGL